MGTQSGGIANRSSSSVLAASSTTLAQANTGRQYLFIQNLSDVVVYIKVGLKASDAVAAAVIAEAGTIYLAANGGSMEWQGETFVPSGSITAIAATGTGKTVTCLEG
jgi:hypothetical protein